MSITVKCKGCSFSRRPNTQKKAQTAATEHARARRGHRVEIVYTGEVEGTEVCICHEGDSPRRETQPETHEAGKAE